MAEFTAEPSRKKAYDVDLRWRIVYQRIAKNLTFERIARNLNISTATAHRIYALFQSTGDVEKKRRQGRSSLGSLPDRAELYVVGLVLEKTSSYINEMCQNIKSILNIEVSSSTVCRLLRRYGITRKKIRQVALQRCDVLRGAFMAKSFMFQRLCGWMRAELTEEIV